MWILATVLGLILFFVVLLSIPVDLKFTVSKENTFRSRVRIAWLFGLVGKDIKSEKKGPKPKKKKKKGKFKSRRHIKPLLAMVKTQKFIRRCLKLLNDLRRVVQIKDLSLDITFGLDDPADTAMVYGVIGPAAYFTDKLSPLNIKVRPDFDDLALAGSFTGDIRLIPIRLFKPISLFAFSPVTIRAIKNMVVEYRR